MFFCSGLHSPFIVLVLRSRVPSRNAEREGWSPVLVARHHIFLG
jgi:hypothetical protein